MINDLIYNLVKRLSKNNLFRDYMQFNNSVRFYFGRGRIETIIELTHSEIIMNNLDKLKNYLDIEN